MLQINNKTPFSADIAIFPNEKGIDTLYAIVKATFTIGKEWVLAEEQSEPAKIDEYWGEPGESSLKIASDFHIGKPFTDIVMIGNAYSRDEQPVKQLDVSLAVGEIEKTIRVFGDRVWGEFGITEAEEFSEMPLVYERAFGGHIAENGETIDAEYRNPVGVGFRGDEDIVMGSLLPNIEDPNDLIENDQSSPFPAGFGLISAHWQSRAALSGTYDELWQQTRAPFLPLDFDGRFLCSAHPDLIYPGYLQGGELVNITNMHAKGNLSFTLPVINLKAKFNVAGAVFEKEFNLETLILQPNALEASLVWRASFEGDKKIRKIKEVSVTMAR